MPAEAFWKLEEMRLAQTTGWTREYIQELDLEWWRDYWGIRDGETKGSEELAHRARFFGGG